MDLKKAFDTVDHNFLIMKLHKYGIRGTALSWLNSYLHNRQQYVELQNHISKSKKITCGVPQGSVLGPLLFNLYINNVWEVSKTLKTILFADDTNLICSGENMEQLLDTVENELQKMKSWFDANKLTLNLSKTKFIIFGNRATTLNKKLMINDIEIERVKELKFLGVIIDEKLCWKPHIHYIKAKISKSIAILYKINYLLNQQTLYTLYCSFILPYITYCLEVWGNTYKTNTEPIFILQKRALRIVNKTTYRAPTTPLFIKLKALKFRDIVDFKTAQIMYKINNQQLSNSIQGLFQMRESKHHLRGTFVFKKKFIRTNSKYHCITTKGVIVWNSCSEEIKSCTTMSNFKRLFKLNILNEYEKDSR